MSTMMVLDEFYGLDERKKTGDDLRFSPSMRNYRVTEDHTLQKRYGRSPVIPTSGTVTGLWSGYLGSKRWFLYTVNGKLYSLDPEQYESIELGDIGSGENTLFEFGGKVYIKNENLFSSFDGMTLQVVTGYVPLVAIGCTPGGTGTPFEDTNLLTGKKRVKYSTDGIAYVFYLPERGLASVDDVKYDGISCPSGWTADLVNGIVTFDTPVTAGIDRLEICYDTGHDRKEVIYKASGVMRFGGDTDGHLFLWGNPDYPAYRFHSELADGQPSAEYFPENNYTVIGDTRITDIIAQYDRQLIFTKDRAYYSYCELREDTLGNTFASFPVFNLNGEKGSLLENAGCIMENEPVTFCEDGLNKWASTTVENEKNAVCFSHPVGDTMKEWISSGRFSEMVLFNLRTDGELYFVLDGTALIYNYRLKVWYAYDNFPAEKMCEYGGKLFFTNENGIEFLDPESGYDPGGKFTAYFDSPLTGLGIRGRRKKLTEMGFTLRAAATPSLVVSYTDEEGDEFPVTTGISHYCGDGKTVSLTFRPPLFRTAKVKFRVSENDYAYLEICELHISAVQKGKYGRTGL